MYLSLTTCTFSLLLLRYLFNSVILYHNLCADCCDGSDEYKSNVKCRNTCWEAGKAARERLRKRISTYQDGVTIRKTEVEKAKQAFAKDEAELANLKAEEKILKGLVQKLKGAIYSVLV